MLSSLPLLREKGLNSKTIFLIKKYINIFLKLLYTVQNVKTVSMYNIQSKNKCNIITHFVSCNRLSVSPEQASNSKQPTYLGYICHSVFFPFGIYADGTFHRAVGDDSHTSPKKIQVGFQEMEFQRHVDTRRHGVKKVPPQLFVHSFMVFYFPKLCCIPFKTRLRLFLRQHSIYF